MKKELTDEERREHGRKVREGRRRAKEKREAAGTEVVRHNQRL